MTKSMRSKENERYTSLELHHAVMQTLVWKTELANQHGDETPRASR